MIIKIELIHNGMQKNEKRKHGMWKKNKTHFIELY